MLASEEETIICLTIKRWSGTTGQPYSDYLDRNYRDRPVSPEAQELTRMQYGIRDHRSLQVAQLVLTVQETLEAGDGFLARLRDRSGTR